MSLHPPWNARVAVLAPALLWGAAADAGSGLLSVGASQTQLRDDIVVPLRSTGGGLTLGGGWQGRADEHRIRLAGGLTFQALANRDGNLAITWAPDLDGTWDHPVVGLGGGTLALGAAVHGDLDIQLHAQWDDSHIYWLGSWGLGPRLAWRRPLGERGIELWTSLPVVGLASRPPRYWPNKVDNLVSLTRHLALAHSAMQPTSVHEWVSWHGGVGWGTPMKRGAMAVRLETRVATASFPERFTLIQHQLTWERRTGAGAEP